MVRPCTITDALQHDTKDVAMHTGVCLLLFGCYQVLGWNFLKPLAVFVFSHYSSGIQTTLSGDFCSCTSSTINKSTLEAF